MIERLGFGVQTGFDVPQAFAPCQLREDHADQLLPTPKMSHSRLGSIALDEPIESLPVDQIHNLRNDITPCVHGRGECAKTPRLSNASHQKLVGTHDSGMTTKQ